MTKQALQQEILAKVKPGTKPSHLKRSKSAHSGAIRDSCWLSIIKQNGLNNNSIILNPILSTQISEKLAKNKTVYDFVVYFSKF